MNDDQDRTQEFGRGGGYRPERSPDERRDDTPPFARVPRPAAPPAGPPVASGPSSGPPPAGAYPPPGGGYRPAAPAPSYGPPMLPTDRGSGGFPAAILGVVVAVLAAAGASFGGFQILRNSTAGDGSAAVWFGQHLQVAVWPSPTAGNERMGSAFGAALIVILVVSAILMIGAAMSTRAGTGGFALFLGTWMAFVLAAGGAHAVAGEIIRVSTTASNVQADFSDGVAGGVLIGWLPALVLVMVHAMRRKPARY